MQDELARIAFGLPVAFLWPLTVPYLGNSKLRACSATAISALYVLAPQIPSASSLALLLATVGVSAAFRPLSGEEGKSPKASWQQRLSTYSPIVAALLLGGIAAALADIQASKEGLQEAVQSDRVAIAGAGLFVAVFLGGSVVARILEPFAHALQDGNDGEDLPSLERRPLHRLVRASGPIRPGDRG